MQQNISKIIGLDRKCTCKNYLYESLTTRITDVIIRYFTKNIRNKQALKFLIGVLFRANIASWMVERYLEIMVKLALPFNIWYLETMIVYLRMGIKYYSENLIEKIEVFKVGEKMVITELCKIEGKLLGNIPKIYMGKISKKWKIHWKIIYKRICIL
jgi:hypothetical protein